MQPMFYRSGEVVRFSGDNAQSREGTSAGRSTGEGAEKADQGQDKARQEANFRKADTQPTPHKKALPFRYLFVLTFNF